MPYKIMDIHENELIDVLNKEEKNGWKVRYLIKVHQPNSHSPNYYHNLLLYSKPKKEDS